MATVLSVSAGIRQLSERTICSRWNFLHFQLVRAGIALAVSICCLQKRLAKMVLKIDRSIDGKYVVLRLSGRMQSEHLEQLKAEMEEVEGVVLDLEDARLVDREAVRFLSECEANGAELKNCSPYIREWIAKEKNSREPK